MAKVNDEKFYVGVPADTYATLNRDAEQFGIYRDNSSEVNMNRFLSLLLLGYYRKYKQERNEKTIRIRETLSPWIRVQKKAGELAEQMMEEIVLPEVPKRKGKNPERLSYKPTRETDQIITEIKENYPAYTQYLCRMFMSYCEKPIHERERIVFHDTAVFLKEACKGKSEIVFTTTNNPGRLHYVIPYDLVTGAEEMNNYLLCQEYNQYNQRLEPVSYRLCRIRKPDYSETSGILDKEVARYLDLMKKNGPQYVITEDTEICVKLTPGGQKSYRHIYFARPAFDRIEKLENGDALFFFSASRDLVFRFIIRFRAGEAEIISPPDLRDRIHQHFRESLFPYENSQE